MTDPDETQRLRIKDTVARCKSDIADLRAEYHGKQRQLAEMEDRLSLIEPVLDAPVVYRLIPPEVRRQDEEGIKVAANALGQLAAKAKTEAPSFNAMVAVSGATTTGIAYSASMVAGSSNIPAVRDFYRVHVLHYENSLNSDQIFKETESLLEKCGLNTPNRPGCESPLKLFREAWGLFSTGTSISPAVLMPLRSCITEVVDGLLARTKSLRRKFTGEGSEQREKVKEILKFLGRSIDETLAFQIAKTLASTTEELSKNKQSVLDRHQLRAQLVSSSQALKALLVAVTPGP
jgi:hypothetical protein